MIVGCSIETFKYDNLIFLHYASQPSKLYIEVYFLINKIWLETLTKFWAVFKNQYSIHHICYI